MLHSKRLKALIWLRVTFQILQMHQVYWQIFGRICLNCELYTRHLLPTQHGSTIAGGSPSLALRSKKPRVCQPHDQLVNCSIRLCTHQDPNIWSIDLAELSRDLLCALNGSASLLK